MQILSLYLICHNRVDKARKAIISILSQTDSSFNFIVSDNSSNDDLERLMSIEFPTIFYVKRSPTLSAIAHFNCCISEMYSGYFCLFHDDDIMHSHFVSEMKKMITYYPEAIAIGCNARVEKFDVILKKPSFNSIRDHVLINHPTNLARRYFSRSQSGIAPFPSYVYNKKLVNTERIPVNGGKYTDVTWLLNIARRGTIVWTRQALMTYRLHETNDGNVESRSDRLTFLAYLKTNRKKLGEEILQDYRCSFIYKKIIKENMAIYNNRLVLANKFLNTYRYSRYFRLSTYSALFSRLIIKTKGF
jgi:glycosyltransferase involved in cell wall biosynthesis